MTAARYRRLSQEWLGIDHAPGAHDDVANAVAGALVTAFKEPGVLNFNRKIHYGPTGIY